jgi:hypothetical protein
MTLTILMHSLVVIRTAAAAVKFLAFYFGLLSALQRRSHQLSAWYSGGINGVPTWICAFSTWHPCRSERIMKLHPSRLSRLLCRREKCGVAGSAGGAPIFSAATYGKWTCGHGILGRINESHPL